MEDMEKIALPPEGQGLRFMWLELTSIGRGRSLADNRRILTAITELCGSCWRGSVCIYPDGKVAPCIMARNWPKCNPDLFCGPCGPEHASSVLQPNKLMYNYAQAQGHATF